MGSNFAVRKNTFYTLGKFDQDFGTGSSGGSGQEADFAWKAFFSQKKMRFERELKVYHVPPCHGSIQHSIRKAFQYGVGKGALINKWLFKKKKHIVTLELVEMMVVPLIKVITDLVRLRLHFVLIHLTSLAGRLWGLIISTKKSE